MILRVFWRPRLMFRPVLSPNLLLSRPVFQWYGHPLSHITLAVWVWVRVTGDAHITRVLGVGMPLSLWHRHYSYWAYRYQTSERCARVCFPSSAHRSAAFVLTCTNSLLKKRKGNRGRTGQLLAIFSLFLVTVPEVFAKINSAQSPRFSSGDSSDR